MNRIFKNTLYALVVLMMCWQSARAADRIAFVVGNSNYEEITSLDNPSNDASDVGKKLLVLGFKLHKDKVHYDLKEREFLQQFNQFVRAANNAEIAFLYYGGHGMQFAGAPHLLPTDIPNDDDLDVVESSARYWGESASEACRYENVADHTLKQKYSGWPPPA